MMDRVTHSAEIPMGNAGGLADVAARLRQRAADFTRTTQQHLYAAEAQSAAMFPSLGRAHHDLAPLLAFLLEHTSREGDVPEYYLRIAAQQATSHRRFGFPSHLYPAMSYAICAGLRTVAGDLPTLDAACRAVETMCARMQQLHEQQDLAGVPPAYAATVTTVERRTRKISVVRLETGQMPDYLPGQHLAVSTELLAGRWLSLTPALPANRLGQMEFHVNHDSPSASLRILGMAHRGDTWMMGAPQGTATDTGRPLVFVAVGTGLAAAKAVVLDLMEHAEHPQPVHLIMAARYPGELYDAISLHNLARLCPWLTLAAVVREADTPPLLDGSAPLPADIPLTVSTDLTRYVVENSPWHGRRVRVVGPGRSVLPVVQGLYRATDINSVSYEAW